MGGSGRHWELVGGNGEFVWSKWELSGDNGE